MSYLSERQCQLCVDRGVVSTERRPLGPQMNNARHQLKAIQVGVCVCVCVCVCVYVFARLYLFAADMEISRPESWYLLRYET